jgi:hypothetical protein
LRASATRAFLAPRRASSRSAQLSNREYSFL